MPDRRQFLAASATPLHAQPRRPNVLSSLDDLGYEVSAAMAARHIAPAPDRMAADASAITPTPSPCARPRASS
jgi:hypothetical protein